jgi:hypothetical protein
MILAAPPRAKVGSLKATIAITIGMIVSASFRAFFIADIPAGSEGSTCLAPVHQIWSI